MISSKTLCYTCAVWMLISIALPALPAADGFAASRFVPERKDDFAFENDKVAFRIYGPALKNSIENSGVDCWLKRVNYPIIDKWYKGAEEGISYHKDHGEGYDPYQVGESLGCGGLALWINGRMHLSNVYRQYRVLKNGPDETVFEVEYSWDDMTKETKEIRRFTLTAGSQLFKADSQIFIEGKPAQVEVAIGVTTHNGLAQSFADPQANWVAVWETINGSGLGTGVVLAETSPSKIRIHSVYQ
jgi:hypothetical protein